MKKIILMIIFLSVFASYANAAITCSPCNVGSCACSISDCATGSLEVYSSSACSSFPQYQLTFSGGSKTWSPVAAGTVYLKAFCDSGAQTACTPVTVSSGGTATTTTTTSTTTSTTSTTGPGQTTTTSTTSSSTTSTTLQFEGVIVNITNNQLLVNRTNEVRVLIGDSNCRIDRNNIYIKYTTVLPVKVDARKMICTDSRCVVQCTYSLAPDADWRNPVELAVLINLTGPVMTVEKNIALADASATTTTTTLRTNATTTTLGSTTTTVRSVNMLDIIPDLRKLQQDLNSVKADVDDLAERLRDIGDTRYRDYYTVSSDISDAVDDINSIIAAINKDPTSQANKQRVRNDLIALRQSIQDIADSL